VSDWADLSPDDVQSAINCVVEGWVDCTCNEPEGDCHTSFNFKFLGNYFYISIEELLSENDWLYLNEEEAFCPACRKQLE